MRFGDLAFRSGLDLRSSAKEFGGFSSLWRSKDGRELVALADNAQWLRARVETAEGHLSGLAGSVLTPLTLANGKRLRTTRFYDTESLAIAGRTAFVGVERNHGVVRFAWNGETFSQGTPIEVPFDFSGWPGMPASRRWPWRRRDRPWRDRCSPLPSVCRALMPQREGSF